MLPLDLSDMARTVRAMSMLKVCPRCGIALRDDSPLPRVAELSSPEAEAAWRVAVDLQMTVAGGCGRASHDCRRYLAWMDPADGGDETWTSDWPGRTGPPDLVVTFAGRPDVRWVERPATVAA